MITYHIQQQKELHHGWCLHMYTCINTYVYMYIYTYTHICTYVYMYMYTAMERVALWMVPLRSTPLALSYGGNPELTASTPSTSSYTKVSFLNTLLRFSSHVCYVVACLFVFFAWCREVLCVGLFTAQTTSMFPRQTQTNPNNLLISPFLRKQNCAV